MVSKQQAEAAARDAAAANADAEDDGIGPNKRNIQMKMFKTRGVYAKVTAGDKGQWHRSGQIIGEIFDIQTKMGRLKDGTEKPSLVAIGEFEAIVDETGEVLKSNHAYLPQYYLETCKAVLDKGAHSVTFAIDVGMTFLGMDAGVNIAYEVKNIIQRAPDSPLEILKRQLKATKKLRLPPPVPVVQHQVTGPVEGEPASVPA